MADVYLTKKGYEKLYEELEFLKNVRRRELSKAIGTAREHGDLGENAEYDAAKDAQAHNERRIAELEQKLAGAKILEDHDIPSDEVLLGATVSLEDMDTGEKFSYMIVSEEESDYEQKKISATSPLGQGLLNHKEGDICEIKVPAGILKYKVIKISRE
ncbi:MAG: transcription elongation factor GreA [Candidatus Omnitrophica bacterium]|nr:transcription elongation factor GreA [Candidatus Omnitrophota bacterium]